VTRAYEEIVDFMAHTNPAAMANFQPSEEAVLRVRTLLDRQKDGSLDEAESRELEQTLQLEHLMRLAKAKARQYLIPVNATSLLLPVKSGMCCEYCLVDREDTFFGLVFDCLIAEKHLFFPLRHMYHVCLTCDRFQGSDIATLDANTRDLLRLFHPRQDVWKEHFELEGVKIFGKTQIGEATVRLLRLNLEERLLERELLQSLGRYPANLS
jgi:hypothetical protein